ncbi:MAG: glycosyltransferase family 39 protein [Sedimentisphaerales bacterium]|nr:glycosyltransferase family 39 protein [Sedimentisphaerales bacterium]
MENTDKTNMILILAVMLLTVVSAFWTLSASPLNNHECYVSIAAREMLQTGDWVMPRYNGEIRLEKTPLCYWLVVFTAKLTGSVNEFSSRLPSALIAILSAAAVLYFTRKHLGFGIAVMSTAVWVSTLSFARYSHSARPEMALCTFVAISMLSFYSAMQEELRKRQIWYMLIFWLSFSLGMLAKGPAPLILVIPPIALYFIIFKQWKKLKFTLPVIGPILFLLIVLPWPIMITHRAPEGLMFWKREFIDRFTGDYASGGKHFLYYLPTIFLLAAPFSVLVINAFSAPFFSVWDKKRPVMWYLWLWFVVQILVMTISGGKRQHYILPAMPAFSILAGICLYDMIFEQKAFTPKQVKRFFIGHTIAVIAGAIAFLYWTFTKRQSHACQSVHIIMMVSLVLGIVIFLFRQQQKAMATALFFAGYCAIIMTLFVYFINPFSYNNPSRTFSTEVGQMVPSGDKLIAFNYLSARTVHYAGRTIPEIHDFDQARLEYEQGAWVIATGQDYQDMLEAGGFEIVLYKPLAERRGSRPVEGGLFHKSITH